MPKEMNDEELRMLLAQYEYDQQLDEAIGRILSGQKCIPFCLNGNYRAG